MQDSHSGQMLPLDVQRHMGLIEEVPETKLPIMPFDQRRKLETRQRAIEKAIQDAKDEAHPDRSRQGPVFFIGQELEINGGRFRVNDILPTGLVLNSLPLEEKP